MQLLLLVLCSILLCIPGLSVEAKSIAIFTYKGMDARPWDPDTIQQGITGSEEAVIYMSQKLAHLGYSVVVFGDPPPNSRHTLADKNPRFVPLDFEPERQFDIGISWRMPDRAEEFKRRAKRVYLWPHDTYHWYLTPQQISSFDDVLWLSSWQRNQWISVNPGFGKFIHIFGNGIDPDQFPEVLERDNPYSCIYSSNYARGLEILLNIWPVVKYRFPQATLDIYYGWQHWGLLSPQKEQMMRLQVEALGPFGVRDHGLVGHEELIKAHAKASFWTYPCISLETFCITGLRAQLAGNIPVFIDGSALTETVRYGFKCTNPDEYLNSLLLAMQSIQNTTLQDRAKMKDFILQEYTWEALAKRWKALFDAKETPPQLLDKTVLVSILARNKAHLLPRFLQCIENLEYDKKLLTLYINTHNNQDETEQILAAWAQRHASNYRQIVFDQHESTYNKRLQKTKEYGCDYYFVADCGNFLTPCTLRELVAKDKPIIAPLLRFIPEEHDVYSNFFFDVTESGYYRDHPNYYKILNYEMVGAFQVPVVHCCYLVKSEYIDKLNYTDNSDDHEFIIFSRSARSSHVDQFICNEKDFGTNVHFHTNVTKEEENKRLSEYFVSCK